MYTPGDVTVKPELQAFKAGAAAAEQLGK